MIRERAHFTVKNMAGWNEALDLIREVDEIQATAGRATGTVFVHKSRSNRSNHTQPAGRVGIGPRFLHGERQPRGRGCAGIAGSE